MPAVSLSRSPQSVQAFGRKKNAVAVSYCKKGRGLIKINGSPIELVEPVLLRYKVFEPILLLGRERFSIMDLRIRVKGGGYTSQIYGAHTPGSAAVVTCTLVVARSLQWLGGGSAAQPFAGKLWPLLIRRTALGRSPVAHYGPRGLSSGRLVGMVPCRDGARSPPASCVRSHPPSDRQVGDRLLSEIRR